MRRVLLLLTLVAATLFAGTGIVLAQQTTPGSSQSSAEDPAKEDTSSKEETTKEAGSAGDSAQSDRTVAGEILVKFKDSPSAQTKATTHEERGGKVKKTLPKINVDVVEVTEGKEKEKVAEYEADSNVEFAEVNGIWHGHQTKADDAKAEYTPNDPQVGSQWQYNNTGQTGGTNDADIDAFEVWDTTRGSNTVKIAILDSGIDQSHEDLASKLGAQRNFTTSSTIDDLWGHGTHVAGSAAAISNNSIGVAGVCQECVLMNGKVLGDDNSGQWDWAANGIIWASDNGAKVINMSLGGSFASSTVEDAVNYAWGKGVVVVASAGNHGADTPNYPAAFEKVISVANTDHNDQKASSSGYGSTVDVAAPGQNILSAAPDHSNGINDRLGGGFINYGTISGTSMAAPHVAGLAGLVWSKSGLCSTNTCVRQQIEDKADQISGTGTYWSKGRINANKSVPGSVLSVYQENDRARTGYAGWNWNYANTNFSGGYEAYNSRKGASVNTSFYGTSIYWRAPKFPDSGKTYVYLDNVFQGTVDTYSASTKYGYVWWKTGLKNTWHTIRLVNSGTKNASSSGYFTDLDAFIYYSPSTAKWNAIQENDSRITYGAWSGTATYRYSYSTAVPAASFRGFTGPSVYARMYAGPSAGYVKATVTDASSGAVVKTTYPYLYASTAAWKWIPISGLDPAKTYNLEISSYNGRLTAVESYFATSSTSSAASASDGAESRQTGSRGGDDTRR